MDMFDLKNVTTSLTATCLIVAGTSMTLEAETVLPISQNPTYKGVVYERFYQGEIAGDFNYLDKDINNYLAYSLKSKYDIKNISELNQFVIKNENLLEVLNKIPSQIEKYFENCFLNLQLVPDYEEEFSQLLVTILVKNNDVEKNYKLLKEFDRAWWLHQLVNIQNKVCIDLEFV